MSSDILGKGLAFPLRTTSRGRIQETQHAQKVKESILMILGTQHGERVMRPTFGCNLRSLVFASNTRATANLARHYVEEGLNIWEPRILLDEVIVENNYTDACLVINIRYRLRINYEAQNLVYPLYLRTA